MTRSWHRVHFFVLLLLMGSGGSAPYGRSQGVPKPAVPVNPSAAGASDAGEVLVVLARKANGGDEKAARDLSAAVLKVIPVTMDATFRQEVERASGIEANRILGVTLLRTGDPELEKQGVACIDKAIQGQSVLAMELKAQMLLEGRFGHTQSVEEAVELLKTARQLPGASEAHRLLGDLALAGTGMPKDAAIALEYYRRGADAGSLSCRLALHRLFREGREMPKDLAEAERFGRAAADSGDAVAAYELGVFYEQYSGETPEWLRAAEWMRIASERGSVPATLRLADYHLAGKLGSVNSDEGTRLLRVAASLGSPEACFRIGEAYKDGIHLPLDPVASSAWFRVAADMGYAPAENAYGLALVTGFGTKADPKAAYDWFRQASEKGNLDAKVNLGELHQFGVGVEQNRPKAREYLEEAAKGGSPVAAQKLADFLATPHEGSEGDPVAAAYWAGRAVALGKADASALYERLRGKLNSTQQAELDRKRSQDDSKPASSKAVP